jgi:UDP-glucose 4-epimerase
MAGKSMVVFGDGNQTRDFNYVEDTASAILAAGLKANAVGQIINIGSGVETSIANLAQIVREIANKKDVQIVHDNPRPGDVPRMYADGTKARKLLEYSPKITLREGLSRLHDWYVQHGERLDDLLASEVVHNWELEQIQGLIKR